MQQLLSAGHRNEPVRLHDLALPMFIVLLVAALVRLPLLLGYEAATYPDTGTYLQAAQDLLTGDFTRGQGRRTPGYPLVIAAVGGDTGAVVNLQLLGGITMSLLMCWLAGVLTGSRAWAVAAGLTHALNLQQLFVERALVTESISALSVIASLALLALLCGRLRRGERPWLLLVALSVLCTYAALVRPQFLGLLIVAPAAVLYAASGGWLPRARALLPAALALLPGVLLLYGWCAVMQAKTGYFTLSNQSGFGVVNHTVEFIEYAPPEYAVVRDILLRERAIRIAAAGHAGNTIWYAWPEIQKATGWTLPEASVKLQAMSRRMVLEHPVTYTLSIARAWVSFWTVPLIWMPEHIGSPALRSAAEGLWWVEHKLLRLGNAAFVLLVAAVIAVPAVRRRVRWDLTLSAITGTILISSLIQAMADQGAGSRYHLPTQSLAMLVVLVAISRWREPSR